MSALHAIDVRVPNIGDSMEVAVLEVLVAVGDRVRAEDPIVTLESDKATMDVPAPREGVVESIVIAAGDRVSEGSVLLRFVADAADAAGAPATAETAPAVPSVPPTATPVIDAGPTAEVTPAAPIAAAAPAVPSPPVDSSPRTAAVASPAVESVTSNGVVHATPSIRRFARELGVDLHSVSGTGPHARITRDDVASFVKSSLAAPPRAAASTDGAFAFPPLPKVDYAKYGPVEVVALPRIRKLSGANLHRNWVTIPHVTNHDEADVTELEAFRKATNAERPDARVTMLAFVMKAVVAALVAYPDVNASLDGDDLVRKAYYHIAFAADTPHGLVVPTVRDVDRKGILALASETAALAAKARDGKLGASDMAGSSFTISSLGGIGGTGFTPIVNAPEVAILGVSRAAMRPMWDGGAFVPRLMLPLSLSYDHRVIDGALAARFNAHVVRTLSDFRRALL